MKQGDSRHVDHAQDQIEQTLHDELERVRSIEARLGQIEEQGEIFDNVVLKAIPARTFLSMRNRTSS